MIAFLPHDFPHFYASYCNAYYIVPSWIWGWLTWFAEIDHHLLRVITFTCNTLFDSPVFCASCFKSLASGFWLMLKYDFMVLSWWCLNEVLILFVRCWEPWTPGDVTEESYASDSMDEDRSPECSISWNKKKTIIVEVTIQQKRNGFTFNILWSTFTFLTRPIRNF